LPTPELRWSEYQVPLTGPSILEVAVRFALGYHGTMKSPDAPATGRHPRGAHPGSPLAPTIGPVCSLPLAEDDCFGSLVNLPYRIVSPRISALDRDHQIAAKEAAL
jgi:hypothetical protein